MWHVSGCRRRTCHQTPPICGSFAVPASGRCSTTSGAWYRRRRWSPAAAVRGTVRSALHNCNDPAHDHDRSELADDLSRHTPCESSDGVRLLAGRHGLRDVPAPGRARRVRDADSADGRRAPADPEHGIRRFRSPLGPARRRPRCCRRRRGGGRRRDAREAGLREHAISSRVRLLPRASHDGTTPATLGDWGARHSLADHLTIDVAHDAWDREKTFWSDLTSWTVTQSGRPEFARLHTPAVSSG